MTRFVFCYLTITFIIKLYRMKHWAQTYRITPEVEKENHSLLLRWKWTERINEYRVATDTNDGTFLWSSRMTFHHHLYRVQLWIQLLLITKLQIILKYLFSFLEIGKWFATQLFLADEIIEAFTFIKGKSGTVTIYSKINSFFRKKFKNNTSISCVIFIDHLNQIKIATGD